MLNSPTRLRPTDSAVRSPSRRRRGGSSACVERGVKGERDGGEWVVGLAVAGKRVESRGDGWSGVWAAALGGGEAHGTYRVEGLRGGQQRAGDGLRPLCR
jgi:hypothetical protein